MMQGPLRPHRQHGLGRRPAGSRRPGQLRRGQGRPRRPHPFRGPRAGRRATSPCNVVAPGPIATAMTDALPEERRGDSPRRAARPAAAPPRRSPPPWPSSAPTRRRTSPAPSSPSTAASAWATSTIDHQISPNTRRHPQWTVTKSSSTLRDVRRRGPRRRRGAVTEDANFKDDLDADSLDLVELVMALEEKLDISHPRGGPRRHQHRRPGRSTSDREGR